MGATMDNARCEWIRSRLPLFAGVGDGLDGPDDDGGDLDVGDRRAIERHLAGCPGCRGRRADLEGAMGALAAIAGGLPAGSSDATSLWPALERRIAARAPRAGIDPGGMRYREPAAGRGPDWAALDDERPLQSAWLQDTLREAAEAVGLGARPGIAGRIRGGPWRVAGVSLAASILLLLVVLPVTWRLRSGAEARMLANAEPVAPMVGPPAPTDVELAEIEAPAPAKRRGIDARELAQAEVIKRPADPAPAADAAAGGKAGSSRFGYDLEHVTPMPPDGRDAKSVY